ncbi:MAG: histone [Lachnospiraceae bacterium]|nr:histone [Lachnospiraceae bacterium]MBQ9136903.1 histone [Lachnospiraceae bacterium]
MATTKKTTAAETKTAKAVTEKTAKTAAKAPAKKATTAKSSTAKTAVKVNVNIQFDNKSYTTDELVKIAKDVWRYDLKKKVSDFKTVELYVKPEEGMAYYVINGTEEGSFVI